MHIHLEDHTLTITPPPHPTEIARQDHTLIAWHGFIETPRPLGLDITNITLNNHPGLTSPQDMFTRHTPANFHDVLAAGNWTHHQRSMSRTNLTGPPTHVDLCHINLPTTLIRHKTPNAASEAITHQLHTFAQQQTQHWHNIIQKHQHHLEETLTRWLTLATQAHTQGFTANDILTGNGPLHLQELTIAPTPTSNGIHWPHNQPPQHATWDTCDGLPGEKTTIHPTPHHHHQAA